MRELKLTLLPRSAKLCARMADELPSVRVKPLARTSRSSGSSGATQSTFVRGVIHHFGCVHLLHRLGALSQRRFLTPAYGFRLDASKAGMALGFIPVQLCYSGRFLSAGTKRVGMVPEIETLRVLEFGIASTPITETCTSNSPS
jgi:hypothetical protein